MSDTPELVHPEWIAAIAAPWTVSPHPNFSKPSISASEALGLIVEYRFARERGRYEPEFGGSEPWAGSLTTAAEQSLVTETQREGCESLWRIAIDDQLPLGARVAAAVLASAASGELDEADVAARKLGKLISRLESSTDSPSGRLALGMLAQQRVLRLYDSAQFSEARVEVDRVLRVTPRAKERGFEPFPVSEGISWRSARVQADIAMSTRARAIAARSTLEFLSGQSWVQVVRSRRGWIEYRTRGLEAERDRRAVRDWFERKLESTAGTRHFMRTGPIEAGYESLLVAELAGSIAGSKENREQLGRILLLQSDTTIHSSREAIRLLRQAGSVKSLQSALTWLRNEGPTESIVAEARTITHRAVRAGWTTEADLLVLESASEFLSNDECHQAIQAALVYLSTDFLGGRSGWSAYDKVWRTVGRLAPGVENHDLIALKAFEHVQIPGLLVEPFASRLVDVVNALEWETISPNTSEAWRNWAMELQKSRPGDGQTEDLDAEALTQFASAILRHTDGAPERMPESGLELAAYLAEHGPNVASDARVRETSDFLVASLEKEASRARSGSFSFGGYSLADVAVAYADQFGDARVWTAVVSHLTDPQVDAVLKEAAIDRLARIAGRLPKNVGDELRRQYEEILRSPRQAGLFRPEGSPAFAEATRLGAALDVIDSASAMNAVMTLGAGDERSRIQAARTLPYVMRGAESAWAQVLLLQLSRDSNPIVRAEASAGLVRSLRHDTGLSAEVHNRIVELLESPGVRVPFFAIQAIRSGVESGNVDIGRFRETLRRIEAGESPRIVARAAAIALEQGTSASQ